MQPRSAGFSVVFRKAGHRELWGASQAREPEAKLECSGCRRKASDPHDSSERAVLDLPWSEFKSTVHIGVYRVKCSDCGVKMEKVPLLPSKTPFSKRFEDAVGQACKSAAALQVARNFGLPERTVRAIDTRYLERWAAARRKLRQMGVDEFLAHAVERSCWNKAWQSCDLAGAKRPTAAPTGPERIF